MAKSSSAATKTTITLTGDQRRQLRAEARRGLQLILLMADIASANPKVSANALATALADEFGLARSYLNNAQKWAKDASLALGVALSDLRSTVESQPERFKTQKDLLDLSKPDEAETDDADADDADGDDAPADPADPANTFAAAVAEALKAGLTEAAMLAAVRAACKAQAGLKKTG